MRAPKNPAHRELRFAVCAYWLFSANRLNLLEGSNEELRTCAGLPFFLAGGMLPNLKESFDIFQVEEWTCGKPIIATCNGGSEAIVALTSDVS